MSAAPLSIAFHALGLLCAIHAVMTNRTAQGAIAWGVSLMTFPYLTVPLYLVFGRRKFEGYREAWRGREQEIREFAERMHAALEPYHVKRVERLTDYQALKQIANTPLLQKNAATLLVDGKATFDSILDGLGRARQHALVQFYIVRDDGLGRTLKAAMIECVRRGVSVFFLYDEIGSKDLPRSYLRELEAAGVEQAKFHSTQGKRNRLQLNFRNHRKSVVVDGHEAWIGGHNVGDEYLGRDPKIGPWRDTHVHVVGPVAQLAQLVWLADWYWAKRALPAWNWLPRAAPNEADVRAMIVAFSPVDEIERAQLFFVHALNAARERIWIATPYF